MSKALAIALGAAVAAEATGVTNLSGGSSGDVDVSVPTKTPGSPLPTSGGGGGGGPTLEQIAALTQDNSGPSEALIAALAASGNKPAQYAQQGQQAADNANVPTAEDVKRYVDEQTPDGSGDSNGSSGSSSNRQPVNPPSGAEPSSPGGKAGKNIADFAWNAGTKQTATAIDRNVPGFGGNAEENLKNIKKEGVDDPVSAVKDSLSGNEGKSGGSGMNPFSNEGAVGDIDVAPEDGSFDPTTGRGANIVKDTAENWVDKGFTGGEENNLADAGKKAAERWL